MGRHREPACATAWILPPSVTGGRSRNPSTPKASSPMSTRSSRSGKPSRRLPGWGMAQRPGTEWFRTANPAVAEQAEFHIRHHGVGGEVKLVHLPFPRCRRAEGLVQLGEVTRFNHDVELADRIGAQAQLAAHHAPGLDPPISFHPVKEGGQYLCEGPFVCARLQIEPDVIDIHCKSLANKFAGRRSLLYGKGYDRDPRSLCYHSLLQ
jgi:hypothetical protein